MKIRKTQRRWQSFVSYCCAGVVALFSISSAHAQTSPPPNCERTVKADVVALDQALIYNRLGAINPAGMIYALKSDVVPIDPAKGLVPGNVQLRAGKRARPIVLRMNTGDCLVINFTNLLIPDLGISSVANNPEVPGAVEAPDAPEPTDAASLDQHHGEPEVRRIDFRVGRRMCLGPQ